MKAQALALAAAVLSASLSAHTILFAENPELEEIHITHHYTLTLGTSTTTHTQTTSAQVPRGRPVAAGDLLEPRLGDHNYVFQRLVIVPIPSEGTITLTAPEETYRFWEAGSGIDGYESIDAHYALTLSDHSPPQPSRDQDRDSSRGSSVPDRDRTRPTTSQLTPESTHPPPVETVPLRNRNVNPGTGR